MQIISNHRFIDAPLARTEAVASNLEQSENFQSTLEKTVITQENHKNIEAEKNQKSLNVIVEDLKSGPSEEFGHDMVK